VRALLLVVALAGCHQMFFPPERPDLGKAPYDFGLTEGDLAAKPEKLDMSLAADLSAKDLSDHDAG
jgi:hypothetical protein